MYFELAKLIKKSLPKTHLIVGGHFPTFEYKKILKTQPAIDFVGRFEGEKTMIELAQYLLRQRKIDQITNLVFRKNGHLQENACCYDFPLLNDLPNPLRTKYPQERLGEKFATLVSSRGCWHASCLYCCIGAFHRKKTIKFRFRNPDLVAKEVADLFHQKGVRLFQFHDDNFMMSSTTATAARLIQLDKSLRKYQVSPSQIAFLIKARPDTIDDRVARLLKKIGTVGVFLGIENASETGLKALCRRTNTANNQKALELLGKYGMVCTYNLLIFHPRATVKEIKENVEFMENNYKFPFDFGRAEVCAGTPLETMLKHKKKLIGHWPIWDYRIKSKPVERMFNIYRHTFRDQSTGYSYLIHLGIALGYQAKTIAQLHRGPLQKILTKQADELIMEIYRYIASQVKVLSTSLDRPWSAQESEQFKNNLARGCRARIALIQRLNRGLVALNHFENIFDRFGLRKKSQTFLKYIPGLLPKEREINNEKALVN
jgi:radical SAM superfamily enzyme YgiQ (UPF0313 family)